MRKMLAAVLCAVLTACNFNWNDNTVGPGPAPSPASSASPTPAPTPTPIPIGQAVCAVEVHFFGNQNCPGNVQPATGERQVKQGCSQAMTASPFDCLGRDVGSPSDEVLWSCFPGWQSDPSKQAGVATLGPQQSNHYNRDVSGSVAGAFTCRASVKGVEGSIEAAVTP